MSAASEQRDAACALRAQRARKLADQHEASLEVLLFAAGIAELQGSLPADPLEGWPLLRNFLFARGPDVLKEAAGNLTAAQVAEAVAHYRHHRLEAVPDALVARILLLPEALDSGAHLTAERISPLCPYCGHAPQGGVLRPLAHGRALSLFCSLCLREWSFRRSLCAHCGEPEESRQSFYSADSLPHLELQSCDSCRRYLLLIDLSKQPAAVPDIDELLGLPLDVWAAEKGLSKICPNLAGI